MKWLLVILCVNISNAKDIPGKITLEFDSKQQCESVLSSMSYSLKFESFKLVAACEDIKPTSK